MPRVRLTLQVRPDRLAEYRERHATVWPEMLRALRDTGRLDYQLFLRGDGLPARTPVTGDLAAAQAAMDATDVAARWEAGMASFCHCPNGLDGCGKARARPGVRPRRPCAGIGETTSEPIGEIP